MNVSLSYRVEDEPMTEYPSILADSLDGYHTVEPDDQYEFIPLDEIIDDMDDKDFEQIGSGNTSSSPPRDDNFCTECGFWFIICLCKTKDTETVQEDKPLKQEFIHASNICRELYGEQDSTLLERDGVGWVRDIVHCMIMENCLNPYQYYVESQEVAHFINVCSVNISCLSSRTKKAIDRFKWMFDYRRKMPGDFFLHWFERWGNVDDLNIQKAWHQKDLP